jgi:hypothetical protein
MNRLKNHLIAAALLSALAIIGTIMNSHQAAAQGPPNGLAVNIVNPVPVPVAGSLGITGTVAATQSGVWNVGLTGNTAANPLLVRDVDGPNRQPFQRIFNVAGGVGTGCGTNFCVISLGTVPTGKFLVLTHFQGALSLAPGSAPNTVTLTRNGDTVFDVPRNSLGCSSDTLASPPVTRCPFNEEIRVIFQAGETARIDTDTGGSLAGVWPQTFVVEGYYVDAPPSAIPLLQQNTEFIDASQPSTSSSSRRTVRLPSVGR